MASLFAKARERAEAAAQQFQASHSSSSAAAAASGQSGNPTSSSGDAYFSYSGVVPHLLRQGIASVDPRYESNRPLHLLSGSIKSFNIDHDALSREAKALAKSTYNWGQSHLPENREDGVGDEMIADVTDRLAYLFHQIAQLEASHCARAEQARATLKKFQKDEMELAARRDKRIRLKRELHALMPQQAVASGGGKAAELRKQLDELNNEDQADEESLSRKKRQGLQQGYTEMFDSMIELGEKTALVARYGKLLTSLVSTEKSSFPAQVRARSPEIPLWEGAHKTAEIRAALQPALQTYKLIDTLPSIPSSGALGLGRADTVSYAVSNRADLEHKESDSAADGAAAAPGARRSSAQHRRASSASEHGRPADPFASAHDAPSSSAQSPQSHLNMSPSALPPPPFPPRRVPSNSGLGSANPAGSLNSPLPPSATPLRAPDPSRSPTSTFAALDLGMEEGGNGNLPAGPTVAETGVVPSGTGGPKSGTLLPRRLSSLGRSKSISAGAVAYLGPAGTYSHQAAVKVFGKEGANLIPMQSITGAVDFVKRGSSGNVKFAVVPIENSTFGPVKESIDGLCDLGGSSSGASGKAYVIGETSLEIQHALLCGPKTYQHLLQLQGSRDNVDAIRIETLSHINHVFSHEQALGQCAAFLERYMSSARKKQVDSTAGAAVAALDVENCTAPGFASAALQSAHDTQGAGTNHLVAAIGPQSCAEEVGIRVLRMAIQDAEDNRTRFLVLASEPLDMVTRSAILPGQLQAHLDASQRGTVRLRSLIRVFDGMEADVDVGAVGARTAAAASAASSWLPLTLSKFQRLLSEVSSDPQTRVRKIERRPAPFVGGAKASSGESGPMAVTLSIWKSAYLVELEVDGRQAEEGRRRFESVATKLGGSIGNTASSGSYFERGVDYLGSWNVSLQSSQGAGEGGSSSSSSSSRTTAAGETVYPSTPARPFRSSPNPFEPSASSSSGISDLATPGHAVRRPGGGTNTNPFTNTEGGGGMVASGSSTSSFSTDTTVHVAPELSEREKKEQEAKREADEVRRHALQARFSRQQQGGYAAETQPSLGGLQESQEEVDAGEKEYLPAYEPF